MTPHLQVLLRSRTSRWHGDGWKKRGIGVEIHVKVVAETPANEVVALARIIASLLIGLLVIVVVVVVVVVETPASRKPTGVTVTVNVNVTVAVTQGRSSTQGAGCSPPGAVTKTALLVDRQVPDLCHHCATLAAKEARRRELRVRGVGRALSRSSVTTITVTSESMTIGHNTETMLTLH